VCAAGAGLLLDASVDDVEDAVTGAGEIGVVGDDDEGFVVVVGEFEEERHDFRAVFGIEVAGGFVGEEDIGIVDKGAGDGGALLFAPGEFGGEMVKAVAEADFFEGIGGGVCGAFQADHGGEANIFEGGEFGEEEVILKDVAHVTIAQAGEAGAGAVIDGGAVEEDAPGLGFLQASKGIEEGGFPGAGGAAEKEFLPGMDGDVDAAEDVDGVIGDGEGLVDVLGLNGGGDGGVRGGRGIRVGGMSGGVQGVILYTMTEDKKRRERVSKGRYPLPSEEEDSDFRT
jgi:hypothetical protein